MGKDYRPESGHVGTEAKKKPAKKRKKRFIVLLAVEILAVLAIASGAFLYFYFIKGTHDQMTEKVDFKQDDIIINTEENVSKHFDTVSEKYTLIMLYGVDSRSDLDNTLTKESNADSEILACIDNETGEVKLVSIHRDTFVKTTTGKKNKLTNIYCSYGVQESLGTINMNLDLNIKQFVTVNWKAVVKAVNLLDGLDLDLTRSEVRAINKFGPHTGKVTGYTYHYLDPDDYSYSGDKKTASVHLDGVQAASYARVRNVAKENDEGESEHDDIARASRQRIVIEAMLEKIKKNFSLGLLDDFKREVIPYIATNIELSDLIGMVSNASRYSIGSQTMFPFKDMYKDSSNQSKAYIYCDTLTENVTKLHEFLFGTVGYEPSSAVKELSDFITEYRYDHR
ncbi:MAG: LCP family protein [Lachnospiraceae bacterium]|nr:LCP family protein [Lachnospiraceae bacterium]